jgi:hypothetical protein
MRPAPRRSPLRGRSIDVRMFALGTGLLRNHIRATPSPWGHGSYEPTPSSPWGQGSYAFTYLLRRRGDTAPTEMRGPHPVGAHSVGEASMCGCSPGWLGSYGTTPGQPLRREDTAPTEMRVPPPRRSPLRGRSIDVRMFALGTGLLRGSRPGNPFAVGTRLLRIHTLFALGTGLLRIHLPSSPWGHGSYGNAGAPTP